MLAMVLVAALNLGSSQGPALGAFQLFPPLLLGADVADSKPGQEAEVPSGFRGDSVDRLESTSPPPRPTCWIVAGTTGGIVLGGWTGIPIAIAGAPAGPSVGASVGGAILLGTAGYFIGRAAQDGSVVAKIGVVVLDILGAGVWVGTTAAVLDALGSETYSG